MRDAGPRTTYAAGIDPSAVEVVDTPERLHAAADELRRSRYASIDLEALRPEMAAAKPGRAALGRISTVQIACYHLRLGRPRVVRVIDVLRLGAQQVAAAFRAPLQSVWPEKLFFDCRNDAQALATQMRIQLPADGVIDLQLAATAARWKRWGSPHRLTDRAALQAVCGLEVRPELVRLSEAMQNKEEVWLERPLPELQIAYAADDVYYHHRLAADLAEHLPAARRLATRYLKQFASGRVVETEVDSRADLVRDDWLEEEVGPPGKCTTCGKPGHDPAACIKSAVCPHCNRTGHTADFCFAYLAAVHARDEPMEKTKTPEKLVCSHCGGVGHTVNRCFRRDPALLQCDHCGEQGHLKTHCRHLVACKHCGKLGHTPDKCQTLRADSRLKSAQLQPAPRRRERTVEEMVDELRRASRRSVPAARA